ncbi:MarR family winged helix-turn-helix transcriptional regulator [Luteipulveratus flavus]|uniref:MarR family transcriptional regulator n=1 Tax=Luteipulveratus flavus TaxID=3031728 RepID=A0ABT6C8T1_9MICO|nr:MarR family transcriptional regulator [Luteipulveratus sp. YIM 133296]MDF8265195.1 MarR family transcriptional regulator [Luteipulveratus sp. YIM 133296]
MANRDGAVEDLRVGLREVSRRLQREWGERMPDVTFAESTLLSAVQAHERATMVDVARALRIDKSTASRQVAALERRGLLTRQALAGERRAQLLVLTRDGTDVLAAASDSWRESIRQRVDGWTDDELSQFVRLLQRYNDHA